MCYGARLLNVSYDTMLLQTRSAILRAAGYAVMPARTLCRAVTLLEHRAFDLVIIGHSIPPGHTSGLVATAHACSTPVLLMTRGTELADAEVDLLFAASDGPLALLRAVNSLLQARTACAVKPRPERRLEFMRFRLC